MDCVSSDHRTPHLSLKKTFFKDKLQDFRKLSLQKDLFKDKLQDFRKLSLQKDLFKDIWQGVRKSALPFSGISLYYFEKTEGVIVNDSHLWPEL